MRITIAYAFKGKIFVRDATLFYPHCQRILSSDYFFSLVAQCSFALLNVTGYRNSKKPSTSIYRWPENRAPSIRHVIHAFVTSSFYYCNLYLGMKPHNPEKSFNCSKNRSFYLLSNTGHHITIVVLLSAEYIVCVLIVKALHRAALCYLRECFSFQDNDLP